VLWERLEAADPAEVAARAAVRWDPDERAYHVPLADLGLRVVLPGRQVAGPDGFPGWEPMLAAIQYLLSGQDEPPAGEWVSPLSLPYGDLFFRGPHDLPSAAIEGACGADRDAFCLAAQALGGQPLEMGDAAFAFQVLPRIPIAVVLWLADDEFPARAQFLFDRAADRQLPLDSLWLLTKVLAQRLVAAAASSGPSQ
jgi:hypothetical protein